MPYLSESSLKTFQPYTEMANDRSIRAKQVALASKETTIFLSHSHDDRLLIEPAAAFLKQQGVRIYVDWLDEEMPKEVSAETAEKLKGRIEEHQKFVLLATSNSKESKWVPWELGYADKAKTLHHIAVLPVNATGGWDYQGTEYVELYPKIIVYEGKYIVWSKKPQKWEELKEWLRSR